MVYLGVGGGEGEGVAMWWCRGLNDKTFNKILVFRKVNLTFLGLLVDIYSDNVKGNVGEELLELCSSICTRDADNNPWGSNKKHNVKKQL